MEKYYCRLRDNQKITESDSVALGFVVYQFTNNISNAFLYNISKQSWQIILVSRQLLYSLFIYDNMCLWNYKQGNLTG